MHSTVTPSTHRASFAIGDEQSAKRVVDLLTESFDDGQAVIAAFEDAGGRWHVTMHFAEAPDQESIRELVSLAAGEIAGDIAFDIVEAKDWVKATLDQLVPVRAGRFIVHGRHDRAKVPLNKIAVEIEAALAFGTGHHGTTRGCLLLLDHVLKAWRPRRVLDVGTGTGDLVDTIRASGFSAPQFERDRPFDLVLANILANPLRQMATTMARHLASSALLILSGLLPHQAQGVIAAYRARGLVLERHIQIEGWSSLLMRKPR